MNAMLLPLLLTCVIGGEELKIVFDNRPEIGVPQEARDQDREAALTREEIKELYATLTVQEIKDRSTAGLLDINNTIKRIRIRYYNKKTWKTEEEARDYVRSLLTNKSAGLNYFQIWSQGVGMPEIECLVDFTDEYRKKLIDKRKPYGTGRLLIWNTEVCFRDATSRWWFVNAFYHYHQAHPKGDLSFKPPKKPK